ncbi:MAG: helix-turn-helix domain-containing protein [Eubacteriales bacterium]|nr:helix-turn-helix domain-containing protein [Eubacteriales bacterium]
MKLSMWMIANRLSSLDMELDIREDAPAVLKSARRVYATNCVHVYQEGNDVVCNGEGDIIRFQNMDLIQGFEIIQSVFDYFQDWMDGMIRLTRERNYQGVIDLAWLVFQNPIVMLDGNNRVLGMTHQYAVDSVDEEWAYLSRYGYSSLNAVQLMRYSSIPCDYWQHGAQAYSGNHLMGYDGLTYCMYCNDSVCGRINVLAKERDLNQGDAQLMEQMAAILEPSLGQIYYESVLNNTNVFYNLLFEKAYEKEALDTQLAYQQWSPDDTYYLALLEVLDISGRQTVESNVDQLMQVIVRQTRNCLVLKKTPYIILLGNYNLARDPGLAPMLSSLAARNPLKASFSLPCRGIEHVSSLYKQALYALSRGKVRYPDNKHFSFYDYAVHYILEAGDLLDSVRACMPAVVQLWEQQQIAGDELFRTLKTFLTYERSITKTSAELFTHRNTVLYRIRKIQDLLGRDLEDPYVREYCFLSIRILELYQWKTSHLKA